MFTRRLVLLWTKFWLGTIHSIEKVAPYHILAWQVVPSYEIRYLLHTYIPTTKTAKNPALLEKWSNKIGEGVVEERLPHSRNLISTQSKSNIQIFNYRYWKQCVPYYYHLKHFSKIFHPTTAPSSYLSESLSQSGATPALSASFWCWSWKPAPSSSATAATSSTTAESSSPPPSPFAKSRDGLSYKAPSLMAC